MNDPGDFQKKETFPLVLIHRVLDCLSINTLTLCSQNRLVAECNINKVPCQKKHRLYI